MTDYDYDAETMNDDADDDLGPFRGILAAAAVGAIFWVVVLWLVI